MAAPTPKPKEERRNRVPPARGEWVDLDPLAKPVLPVLPKREKGSGSWSARTRTAWSAWRSDAVTGQYGPADIQNAIDLIFLYEEFVRGKDYLAGEIRQRQDRLGLNPKGKRDLRWRAPQERKPEEPRRSSRKAGARRAHLTAVQ